MLPQGWVKSLESWVWIDFSLSVFMLSLFSYVFLRNPITRLHKAYLTFHFLMLMWPVSHFLMHMTEPPAVQLFFFSLSFAALSLQGLGWAVFIYFLTGRSYLLTRRIWLLLAAPTALSVSLIISNPSRRFVGFGTKADFDFGPFFMIFLAQLFLCFLVSINCIIRSRLEGMPVRRRGQVSMALKGQLMFLLFVGADILLNVLFDDRFPDIAGLTSFGMAVAALYFCISIHRYRVFDIVRIAQRDIANSMTSGLMVLDADGTVLEVNHALQSYLSVRSGDRFDMRAYLRSRQLPAHTVEPFLRRYSDIVPHRAVQELALELDEGPFSGSLRHVQMEASPILTPEKELLGRVITFQDVTEIRHLVEEKHRQNEMLQLRNRELVQIRDELFKANLKLEELATTDSLTGCYNRRFLMQRLEHEVVSNMRYRIPYAIIVFDIDHFKGINDRYGHLVGDEVLLATAVAVKDMLRRSDVLARYGGEEFTVYLPHTTRTQAERLAERLKLGVESNRVRIGGSEITLSITISLGLLSIENQSPLTVMEPKSYLRDLFQEADSALYEAKNNGRNCVVGRMRA